MVECTCGTDPLGNHDPNCPVTKELTMELNKVHPHDFVRRGLHFWICDFCYAPKKLHPRLVRVRARPLSDNTYISADAPHFKEGW